MSEKKTNKVPVRDLKPSTDAKGGRHGHHHGHHLHNKSGGSGAGQGRDRDGGPPYL